MKNFFINLTVTSALLTTISPLAFAQNSNNFKLNNHVLATKKDNIAFKTFTAPGWFSFQHPVNWTVTSNDYSNQPNSGFALAAKYMVFIENTTSFTATPPVNYITSQIDIYPVTYEELVTHELSGTNNLIKLGGGKYKKGSTKVGGREAFRIWFYSDTTTMVTTLIRYSDNETVRVISSYDPSNSSALPLIEKIHGSFRSLKQTSNSSSLTASKKNETKLPSGAYYAMGTMFNNSRREILNRHGRTCIKIVDGPPNNVRGREEIMISSVSNRGGKLYIDGKNQEIEIIPLKNFPEYEFLSQYSTILAGFGDNSGGAWALIAGNKSDSRTTPEQNQRMQECINTPGKYIRKIKGRLIPGRF